jgi:hypothetical protein
VLVEVKFLLRERETERRRTMAGVVGSLSYPLENILKLSFGFPLVFCRFRGDVGLC